MTVFSTRPWLVSYASDVPLEIAEPTETLVDMIWNSTRTYRDAVALEFFGATTTYERLRESFRFYDWDAAAREVRWMTSFDTTEDDIDTFVAAIRAELGA